MFRAPATILRNFPNEIHRRETLDAIVGSGPKYGDFRTLRLLVTLTTLKVPCTCICVVLKDGYKINIKVQMKTRTRTVECLGSNPRPRGLESHTLRTELVALASR